MDHESRAAGEPVYLITDLALQAAVLAHGIAETQPFVDGNKRTALVTMLTFLEVNGQRVRATDPELADWIISLGRGRTPESLAASIRDRLVPTPGGGTLGRAAGAGAVDGRQGQ